MEGKIKIKTKQVSVLLQILTDITFSPLFHSNLKTEKTTPLFPLSEKKIKLMPIYNLLGSPFVAVGDYVRKL